MRTPWSCSVCASIGAEETTARASQPRYEALNLSGEGRDKAVPVSTSADRSICEPQDRSLRCASAAAGPEPGECEPERPRKRKPGGIGASVREAYRSAYSQCSQALTVRALLPNKQHKECVYPHPLNNAGRDEHTS